MEHLRGCTWGWGRGIPGTKWERESSSVSRRPLQWEVVENKSVSVGERCSQLGSYCGNQVHRDSGLGQSGRDWGDENGIEIWTYFKGDLIFLFIYESYRQRGRGRSRLPARNPTWDSIPGLQDQALGWRQTLDRWATQGSPIKEALWATLGELSCRRKHFEGRNQWFCFFTCWTWNFH